MLGQPLCPGESGIDRRVETSLVLITPTREQIRKTNPNYMEHKFPQTKTWPLMSGQPITVPRGVRHRSSRGDLVLGMPMQEQIRTINPNCMEHKVPQIKSHLRRTIIFSSQSDTMSVLSFRFRNIRLRGSGQMVRSAGLVFKSDRGELGEKGRPELESSIVFILKESLLTPYCK